MQVSARSYLTAGIAALGAGAMALTPVQPLPHNAALVPAQVNDLAIGLASSIDPITPWIDTFQDAANNVVGLFNDWASAPFPILQQVIANMLGYLADPLNISGNISAIIENIGNAIRAPWVEDISTLDTSHVEGGISHQLAYTLLPQIIAIPDLLQPVLEFTTNFTSGVLLGAVSPFLAPVVALVNSVTSAISSIVTDSDFVAALNTLINIPAAMVNGFLNGGPVLNLTPLVNLLGMDDIKEFGITLGGLLSPGGTIFNAVDATIAVNIPPLPSFDALLAGISGGALGSLIGLNQWIAKSITPATAPAASVRALAAAAEETPVLLGAEDGTTVQDGTILMSSEADASEFTAGQEVIRTATGVDETGADEATDPVMTMYTAPQEVIRGTHTTPRRAHAAAASSSTAPSAAAQSDDAPKASAGRSSARRAH